MPGSLGSRPWLGVGHSIPWYHDASTFPLGGGNDAVLLLDNPARLPGPDAPRLDYPALTMTENLTGANQRRVP
jgi:hypothetical protein